jgi:hypothetical protein
VYRELVHKHVLMEELIATSDGRRHGSPVLSLYPCASQADDAVSPYTNNCAKGPEGKLRPSSVSHCIVRRAVLYNQLKGLSRSLK